LEELVAGLLRPRIFPFGKLSKAKPAAQCCIVFLVKKYCLIYILHSPLPANEVIFVVELTEILL
jgi:hypothetical protein